MQDWDFDVGVSTHDWLKRGVLVVAYSRVTVRAASYAAASLTAYAMAAGRGFEVTELLWRF